MVIAAFYSFRMFFLVFHGKPRWGHGGDHGHDHGHDRGHDDGHHGEPRGSPAVITVPLVLLAIPSVVIGFVAIGGMLFGDYFGGAIFVDAARGLRRPFVFTRIGAGGAVPAMSHSLRPVAVLALAAELYGRRPEAWVLAIRGHRWTLGEGLSAKAEANLVPALEFLVAFLKGARP